MRCKCDQNLPYTCMKASKNSIKGKKNPNDICNYNVHSLKYKAFPFKLDWTTRLKIGRSMTISSGILTWNNMCISSSGSQCFGQIPSAVSKTIS